MKESIMTTDHKFDPGRRRAVLTGGSVMAGMLVVPASGLAQGNQSPPDQQGQPSPSTQAGLPVQQMEQILRADGMVQNGVLSVSQDRDDLNDVMGPGGIPFKPAFQVRNDFYFQSLGNGRAIVNGELALLS